MDSSPTASDFVTSVAFLADLWTSMRIIIFLKKEESGVYCVQRGQKEADLHIFSGEVNGAVGSDRYNVKDDGPSRIKVQKSRSLTANIGAVYSWLIKVSMRSICCHKQQGMNLQESGFPANSYYYCFLRNFRKRALENAYVDSAKPPTVEDFDFHIDEIVDASAMLCNRDG
ncbi:hypothetical protein C5167_026384, partial [Papaver somniferum]